MAPARRPPHGKASTKANKTPLKPPLIPETFPTNFRLSVALVKALDEWIERLNAQNPMGRQWTRTDVVQDALAYAVRVWGAEGRVPGDPSVKDTAA